MNDAQETAYKQIKELLDEHFDAHVLIVKFVPDDDEKKESNRMGYGGGWTTAIGLARLASLRLEKVEYEDDAL